MTLEPSVDLFQLQKRSGAVRLAAKTETVTTQKTRTPKSDRVVGSGPLWIALSSKPIKTRQSQSSGNRRLFWCRASLSRASNDGV